MIDMFRGVDKIESGLNASWMRNDVILNNIANVDTPYFNRSSVEFEDYYKAALNQDDEFKFKKTREKHMDFGFDGNVEPRVVTDTSTTMRMDGNNVDADKEMADLAKNYIYYANLSRKVTGELSNLRLAIREGR